MNENHSYELMLKLQVHDRQRNLIIIVSSYLANIRSANNLSSYSFNTFP